RGAGGQLVNHSGQRFMFDYDDKGERATRDVVSRGIYSEMRKNNDPSQVGVFISMAHLGPENVGKKFKGMVKRCADCGFDLAGGLVEVVPTAHYFMGGAEVDVDTRTALPGLYAAGEDAGGAHGANRLGGNGVANSTVFGGIAGDVMGVEVGKMTLTDPDETAIDAAISRATAPFSTRPAPVQPLRQKLQEAMWEDVGVMRTEAGMERGLRRIAEIREELSGIGVAADNLAFNLTWHDWLNLASLLDVSEVIAKAGLARENSRGAHYREDFPEVGDLEASYFTRASGNRMERAAVEFTHVSPGESILPEGAPETLVAAP
ncbi:MAG: FAD-binding protein, partial [Pseudomonadota bacterium]